MAKKKVKTKSPLYIKIDTELMERVRKYKKKTGVPMSIFIEQALTEKLSVKTDEVK